MPARDRFTNASDFAVNSTLLPPLLAMPYKSAGRWHAPGRASMRVHNTESSAGGEPDVDEGEQEVADSVRPSARITHKLREAWPSSP